AALVERDAAVDDERFPTLHDGEAVHAYLAEASERDHAHGHGGTSVTWRGMSASPTVPLENRRFVIVTGKGGVGKTTVCAALAHNFAAHRGKRVLIAMCNAKERLSKMLGSDLIGPDV